MRIDKIQATEKISKINRYKGLQTLEMGDVELSDKIVEEHLNPNRHNIYSKPYELFLSQRAIDLMSIYSEGYFPIINRDTFTYNKDLTLTKKHW